VSYYKTISEVERELGDSADAVAARLRECRVTGFREGRGCPPVAEYFRSRKYLKTWPGAGFNACGVFFHDSQIMDYYFGAAIQDFNKRFEAGEFPDLDKEQAKRAKQPSVTPSQSTLKRPPCD
jgi:hypothetical protein